MANEVTAGAWIMFRGSKRFVVLASGKSHSLILQKIHGSGPVAYYGIGIKEWDTLKVVAEATPATIARARRLLESTCLPHTRIEWGPDGMPTYIHTVSGVEHRIVHTD